MFFHKNNVIFEVYNLRKISQIKVLNRLSKRVSKRSAFVFPFYGWLVMYTPLLGCVHVLSPQNTCRGRVEIWGVFLITRSIFSINSWLENREYQREVQVTYFVSVPPILGVGDFLLGCGVYTEHGSPPLSPINRFTVTPSSLQPLSADNSYCDNFGNFLRQTAFAMASTFLYVIDKENRYDIRGERVSSIKAYCTCCSSFN